MSHGSRGPVVREDVHRERQRRQGAEGPLPAILYLHGTAGYSKRWPPRPLVRELAVDANVALAFVEYPNSPEGGFPGAIEQGYAIAQWITREGPSKGPNQSRIAVAGVPPLSVRNRLSPKGQRRKGYRRVHGAAVRRSSIP